MQIDFGAVLKERHTWALRHKEGGGLVMGCYSAMVPEELMWSCGVLPVQLLMSPGAYGTSQAVLPTYVCDCSKSILEDYMNGTYGYLDGLMVSHVCETIRGLAGICSVRWPDRFVHVFTAPAGNDDGAREYLKAELISLAQSLHHLGAVPLSEDRLETAISVYNENRGLISELYRIRGENPGAVEPEQVLSAVLASGIMPKDQHNRMLREFLKGIGKGPDATGTRIMVSGLLFENEVMEGSPLFSILRACHALVVWDDLASGMRYRLEPVENSPGADPLDRLVERFMGPQPAPLRSPTERKAGQLLQAARETNGEGFIFLIPKYCDPILLDMPDLTRILEKNGFPTLCLEVSGSLPEGQMRTRVEAFLEILSSSSPDSFWA
ncbi:MAG: 2-hydroxyacyl-CoA dehydratase [Deltaproteobacteria bacterium]|nr:2-hydroxyacyl-CoA dehydratase [Deltaproteobacteria bacterium]